MLGYVFTTIIMCICSEVLYCHVSTDLCGGTSLEFFVSTYIVVAVVSLATGGKRFFQKRNSQRNNFIILRCIKFVFCNQVFQNNSYHCRSNFPCKILKVFVIALAPKDRAITEELYNLTRKINP